MSPAIDGWIVFTFDTTGGLLATDGNTWVRIDDPPGADQNAIGIRGAVVSGTEWILLPNS